MRKTINPEEMKTKELGEYALVAIALLGGSAMRGEVIDKVGLMLKDVFQQADQTPVYQGPNGRDDYAPPGAKRTWPAWSGKTSISLLNLSKHGWITRSKGVCTLTPEGMKHVAMHAENWLKTK